VDLRAENVISLFSGIGGLDLGTARAIEGLGGKPRTVCYVEGEAFACSVLVKQMAQKALDAAPIWSDIKTFDGGPWRGKVSGIIGGYPCQPFSLAGSQLGEKDPRHLWPEVRRLLAEIQPNWAFFENVQGHLKNGFPGVLLDLAILGFDVQWGIFSAEEEGAPHIRKRLFILANANSEDLQIKPRGKDSISFRTNGKNGDSSNANSIDEFKPKQTQSGHLQSYWRETQSPICRVDDGVPDRVDQLRALGNSVVPQCAERAFVELFRRSSN